MREWPYTASSRYALGCVSPPTIRFSSGFCPQEISWLSGMCNPLHPSSWQFTYSMLSFGQYLLKLEDAVCLSVNNLFGNVFTFSWEFCQGFLLSNIHLHTDGNRQPEEIRQQQKLGQCTMPAALVTIIIIIQWGTTVFSCPKQLNRWPCQSLTDWLTN